MLSETPDWVTTIVSILLNISALLGVFLTIFALISVLERKILGRMQNRYGPNRVGPFGLFQPIADGIKMLIKEDVVPARADKVVHFLAPILVAATAILTLGVIPYGRNMLLAFLGIYFINGTFDFASLAGLGKARDLLPGNFTWVAFAGIFLGLAVKVPLFPFHTWLPDAYEAAPTGVSMVLTGALSKMGVYGFIRLLLPLFPNEITTLGPWLLTLTVCSIVIPPLVAWAQADLKRMVAYLSINHLGYCMLGLFAATVPAIRPLEEMHAALSGVFMQIFNHGITAAALFY